VAWDKTRPAGNLAPSVGGADIRANFDHLEQALGAEHDFPGGAAAGARRHKFARGDAAARAALSGAVAGSIFLRTDRASVDHYDGAAWKAGSPFEADATTGRLLKGSARPFWQATPPTALSVADAAGTTTLDDALLWLDTGSRYRQWARDETGAAWRQVEARAGLIDSKKVDGYTAAYFTNALWRNALDAQTIAFTLPAALNGAAYSVLVRGLISCSQSSGGVETLYSRITENGVSVAESAVSLSNTFLDAIVVDHWLASPVAGTTYTYILEGRTFTNAVNRGYSIGPTGTINGQCRLTAWLIPATNT